MENVFARIRRMGFLISIGLCVIIYLALGIVYFQQGQKQQNLEMQISKAAVVLVRPLHSADALRAEYDAVNRALAPIAVPDALEKIVVIAKQNGIDVTPDAGKFNIPPPSLPVGRGAYQVITVKDIKVQGSYANVMAFISDLDSGKTLKTMALKAVEIKPTELKAKSSEESEIVATLNVDIHMKP